MNRQALTLLLVVLLGCDQSVNPEPSAPPPGPSTTRAAGEVPAIAAAFGLGPTATPGQMIALERRVKASGTFRGQVCGMITRGEGAGHGFYTDTYQVAVPGFDKPQYMSFGHIQHGEHPIRSVGGPEFEYRLEGGRFALVSTAAGP